MGRIVSCEKHPDADSLYVEQVGAALSAWQAQPCLAGAPTQAAQTDGQGRAGARLSWASSTRHGRRGTHQGRQRRSGRHAARSAWPAARHQAACCLPRCRAQIDVGEPEGPRTIVSGLVKYVPLEAMQVKGEGGGRVGVGVGWGAAGGGTGGGWWGGG